jgi:hypothetical protein
VGKKREVPEWLDPELLFRLNYGGPTTVDEMKSVKDAISVKEAIMIDDVESSDSDDSDSDDSDSDDGVPSADKRKRLIKARSRTEITLLDRPIAAKLHKALYGSSSKYSLGFHTDWSPDRVPSKPALGVSPFDYVSSVQTFPMVWSEDFVVNNVWGEKYSSSVVGKASKPPLAAVVMDMIDLVEFLVSIDSREPQNLVEWTKEFVRKKQLRSVISGEEVDVDWAARGYIADMFSIVACVSCTSAKPPERYSKFSLKDPEHSLVCGQDSKRQKDRIRWAHQKKLPGSGVLLPKAPPVALRGLEPSNPVAELTASYVYSGPFRFKRARCLDEHLTFNNHGQKIRLFQYWGSQIPKEGLPKYASIRIYQDHALRRFKFNLNS